VGVFILIFGFLMVDIGLFPILMGAVKKAWKNNVPNIRYFMADIGLFNGLMGAVKGTTARTCDIGYTIRGWNVVMTTQRMFLADCFIFN
jgi:hypothetical protein